MALRCSAVPGRSTERRLCVRLPPGRRRSMPVVADPPIVEHLDGRRERRAGTAGWVGATSPCRDHRPDGNRGRVRPAAFGGCGGRADSGRRRSDRAVRIHGPGAGTRGPLGPGARNHRDRGRQRDRGAAFRAAVAATIPRAGHPRPARFPARVRGRTGGRCARARGRRRPVAEGSQAERRGSRHRAVGADRRARAAGPRPLRPGQHGAVRSTAVRIWRSASPSWRQRPPRRAVPDPTRRSAPASARPRRHKNRSAIRSRASSGASRP